MNWRQIWFQTHWFVGITAGIVLAIVGLSGALLSYEQPILKLLNTRLMTVAAAGRTQLPPDEIVAAVLAANPGKRVNSITLSSDPDASARVVVAERGGSGEASGPGRRRTTLYVDPYTGSMLGEYMRGDKTMHVIEDVHRRLAAGDTGKLIVGVSTLLLLLMAGTGLYLRWPKVASALRTWFTFKLALKGRLFLWHLHAVIGTWVLLFYVLASLTGMYWSFDWYRDGLFAMTGAPRPQPQGVNAPSAPGTTLADSRVRPGGARPASASPPSGNVKAAWATFQREVPSFGTVTLTYPRGAKPQFEIRYLAQDPRHERAFNRLIVDATSGGALKHERYGDKPAGEKLMSSILMLHSGGYFGWAGTLAMMLASLAMPVFAVTGWMLYLERRRRKARARALSSAGHSAGAYVSESP